MSKVLPEKWIQTKVTIGFAIIVAIALVIFTISYFSVVSIIKVQNEEYGYEKEFTHLNQLISEIIEVEGVSRVYGITAEESYYNEYVLHHDSVLSIIHFLPQLFPDTVSINGINEIERLYLQKKELMDQLVQINIINFHSSSALDLLASLPDSLSYDVTQFNYARVHVDSLVMVDTLLSDTAEQDLSRERKGFLRRMSDFLGGKKKKDSVLDVENVVTQPVDSNVTMRFRANNDLRHIKTELKKVSKQEALFNLRLKRHEYDLIKLDRLLTEQLKNIIRNLQDITVQRDESKRVELEGLRSDMIDRILMLVGSAIFLMLFFIFWISRDISKSRKLKNDIIQSKEKVDQLLRVKEQFVAHMSHEIRTPLTSIIGFSEQLNEPNHHSEHANIAERIRLSAEHLNGLINNILDFSMLESGNIEFYKDQINARVLLHELFQLFELKAHQAAISLSYQIDPDLEFFESDALRLKQVMINLIGNAIKFTHKGSVEYHLQLKKDKVVFTVVDTGIGIPKDKQKTIFKMFNQVNISLSRKYSGTGLGLSISRQIIEAMGGSISLESKVGEGSVFKFDIPFVQAKATHQIAQAKPAYNFSDKNIMAIDDDAMICQLIDGMLHDKVSRLDVHLSPSLALNAIDQVKYDLFMIDLHMPKMDGLQLLKIIREKKQLNTPILFLTADMVNSELKKAHQKENIWVLPKPFTQSQVFEKLALIFHMQNTQNITPAQTVVSNSEQVLFSFEDIQSFTGTDEIFFKTVVQTFIGNTDQGIKDMAEALKEPEPYSVISERAHKLLTGFRQFKIRAGIELLLWLEKCREEQVDKMEMKEKIKELSELWHIVKDQVNKSIS